MKLIQPYRRNGLTLPAGATGTIVKIYPQIEAYVVDFDWPFSVLEILPMNLVVPVSGQTATGPGTPQVPHHRVRAMRHYQRSINW